ncbi:hypothetical protein [Enterovibrio norvegicus]|uniref:hypothetical protein n=1 Tax=Enterovibrio norvegicus TaxID=188144 RepID=UPI0002D34FF6|nr:hypothetical protein [Enterovibrio norvegicus]
MNAMIANDEEKEWMYPLVSLRNELEINDSVREKKLEKLRRDRNNRDFRRMNGTLTVHVSKHGADVVHGPYIQKFREHMLKKVLEAQIAVQHMGPPEVKDLELLTLEDLEAIRKIWLEEKHEIEDNLPKIYEQVIKQPYAGKRRAHHPILNSDSLSKLKTYCEQHGDKEGLLYQQIRATMSVANKFRSQLRRAKLGEELNEVLDKGAFNSMFEAKEFALERERHRLHIQLTNDQSLASEEQDKIKDKIHMITKCIKEQGYSSLPLETEIVEID